MVTQSRATFVFCVLLLANSLSLPAAFAAGGTPLEPEALHLQTSWDFIKFSMPAGDEQARRMNALGGEADAVAARHPDSVDVLIWDGIITSERAAMANPLSALGLAKRARDILEKANRLDPAALDAGAPTSLAVLYYRVPSFPFAFGDTTKARQLFEQATRTAPNGLDAWYFYGDFLFSEKQYDKASEVLSHALTLPQYPDRALWDQNRRVEIQELLTKIGYRR
jgi:tetratricopeptide (TPR) repeat protein